jgi:hypothetical protein
MGKQIGFCKYLAFLTLIQIFCLAARADYVENLKQVIYEAGQVEAATADDLQPIEDLLAHVPAGIDKPLEKPANSRAVLILLYNLMLKQYQSNNEAQLRKIVERAIELGANPMRISDPNLNGIFASSPAEFIFKEWYLAERKPGWKLARTAFAARQMFDVFYATKSLNLDYQIRLSLGRVKSGYFDFVHWLVLQNGPLAMINYFLGTGVGKGPTTINNFDVNIAMMAVAKGDLAVLKSIVDTCEKQTVVDMFSYRCPSLPYETVLYTAVKSAHRNGSNLTIKMIKYLAANGADLQQDNLFRNLIAELDLLTLQHPNKLEELQKLRSFLIETDKLIETVKACADMLANYASTEKRPPL